MAAEYFPLDAAGWTSVQGVLNDNQRSPNITPTIVGHLRALGAAFVIIEREYLDRDFSEAYSSFYSRLFRRHSKTCTRLLFFSNDLTKTLRIRNVGKRSRQLQAKGNSSFLGYIVLRPIHEAPLAQAVLRVPPVPHGLEARLQVKSSISVHVLGAEFSLEGIPMTQQDQRIGACAQAAIWTCARHFYYKHRGPWVSMVGVNEAAMSRAQWNVSVTIPNGSEFLTFSEMVHALQGIGRKSLVYMADSLNPVSWSNLRPEDIISRYVDSGIPVIVGMPSP